MDTNQECIGNENVIIGNGRINGDRNVIINATDANGNIILNRPMIIGYNAKGGPNDIVIGSGANAGSELFLLLNELIKISSKENPQVVKSIVSLISEIRSPKKDKNKITTLRKSIKAIVTVGSAVDLIYKISPLITSLLASMN